MVRLFVALPLPDAVRESLRVISNGLPGARWAPPENLHVTLRFIGEIDHNLAHDVHDALARIEAPAQTLAFEGLDWFGSKQRPATAIMRVAKTDALIHLQRKVESACVRAGLRPESRKFCPHVTLARLRTTGVPEIERYRRERAAPGPDRFDVDRFVLYSSFLSHNGPIYQEEADYPLTPVYEPAE